jgi:hypothetical protein
LLLDAAADANEAALVVRSVRRGRGIEYVRLLIEHAADVEARGGEWSMPPERQRTA